MVRRGEEVFMGKKILAGVLGGVAFFVWSWVGHDLLPLGQAGLKEAPNEEVLTEAMKTNILDHGLYFFPGLHLQPNATMSQKGEAMQARLKKIAAGPSGILVYHPTWDFSFAKAMPTELGTNIIQMLLAVLLLGQTSLTGFAARWRFLTIVGLVAAITTNVSYWNWYGFPGNYTVANIFSIFMGFAIAGLVAAAIAKPAAATAPGTSGKAAGA
jgi:hypothetical protein